MLVTDPIVQPIRHPRSPRLGPVAVMAATEADLAALRERMALPDNRRLYISRLYYDKNHPQAPSLIGPVIGAPYAAMVLETLRAWGAEKVVFAGWCGSIAADLNIGDILLPDAAFIDEGTSLHYDQASGSRVTPDAAMHSKAVECFRAQGIAFQQGAVWTTDGVFRETHSKVRAFQKKGALAVEMEVSALMSTAAFRGMSLAGLLVVSDELFSGTWRAGFKDSAFVHARAQLVQGIAVLTEKLVSL